MKKIGKNLLIAIGIIIYFFILIFAYTRMNTERLSKDIQVFAGAFLIVGLFTLEKAYKKDSGKIAITGIELLVLSFHSVSIMHMTNLFKCDFKSYLLISSCVITIYYVLKAIVIYTKNKKEYLKGLSDISEIVKEDEPVKKEAKKRNTKKEKSKKENEKEEQKNKKKEADGEKNSKKADLTKEETEIKKTSSKKNTSSSKKTQTKKTQDERTIKSEETEVVRNQKEKKVTKKLKKADEQRKERKSQAVKKNDTKKKEKEETSEIPKKKTTKSKKEVKEND